jgi:uncharacterized membrane protein (UPF0136 family)
MKFSAITALTYSLLLFIGGMIGYYKAHSVVSLAMGTAFAVLLLICGIAMLKSSILGYFSAAGLSLLLTIFFTYRFYMTEKFFPSGIMALISLVVVMIFLFNKTK